MFVGMSSFMVSDAPSGYGLVIVVEHRDQLMRFGFEHVEAMQCA